MIAAKETIAAPKRGQPTSVRIFKDIRNPVQIEFSACRRRFAVLNNNWKIFLVDNTTKEVLAIANIPEVIDEVRGRGEEPTKYVAVTAFAFSRQPSLLFVAEAKFGLLLVLSYDARTSTFALGRQYPLRAGDFQLVKGCLQLAAHPRRKHTTLIFSGNRLSSLAVKAQRETLLSAELIPNATQQFAAEGIEEERKERMECDVIILRKSSDESSIRMVASFSQRVALLRITQKEAFDAKGRTSVEVLSFFSCASFTKTLKVNSAESLFALKTKDKSISLFAIQRSEDLTLVRIDAPEELMLRGQDVAFLPSGGDPQAEDSTLVICENRMIETVFRTVDLRSWNVRTLEVPSVTQVKRVYTNYRWDAALMLLSENSNMNVLLLSDEPYWVNFGYNFRFLAASEEYPEREDEFDRKVDEEVRVLPPPTKDDLLRAYLSDRKAFVRKQIKYSGVSPFYWDN